MVEFKTGYVLWYHSVTEKSWALNSYINLCEDLPGKVIKNAEQLWSMYKVLNNNFTAGMFFLMKEGIMPTWEDPKNKNGGFWSFKVPKRISNDVWKKLTAGFVGNTLTSNGDYMNSITGITISPKISNCVMKIMNGNMRYSECNLFTKEIDYLNPDVLRYNKYR
jgi:hypothetical protein